MTIINKFCCIDRELRGTPYIFEVVTIEVISPITITIYDCESLKDDKAEANDHSNSEEKSHSSVQLAASVAIEPPSTDHCTGGLHQVNHSHLVANEEEEEKGNCSMDIPKLWSKKLKIRSPQQEM